MRLVGRGQVLFLHAPDYTSAPALWACAAVSRGTPTRLAFGDTDDAAGIVGINIGGAKVAMEISCGLETRIDISGAEPFTAFETSGDAFSCWDLKRVGSTYIFAAARSSGVTREAENIWCGSTEGGAKRILSTKLSSHHGWMLAKEMPQCAPFYWTSQDRTALQGIMAHPRGREPKHLPTVVVPHGGPYGRDVLHMRISRGTDFARAANGGTGTLDYADVESMLTEAIQRGYADREKVAIAGYSQGGFLAAWGCTRPNAICKVGVVGAGPTDLGSLIICSDVPDAQNVKVPLLVIHGGKDDCVPLSQAVGFMRGLVRETDKSEGHMFKERAHIEDQLTRVLAHIKKYLS
ncbi:Alpha/Beta hydrolase protein [Mycena latifolia]|nr:Alpha/Beta hydrolase protein [Mycena latifolia]